jgi:hypothetical protein
METLRVSAEPLPIVNWGSWLCPRAYELEGKRRPLGPGVECLPTLEVPGMGNTPLEPQWNADERATEGRMEGR